MEGSSPLFWVVFHYLFIGINDVVEVVQFGGFVACFVRETAIVSWSLL